MRKKFLLISVALLLATIEILSIPIGSKDVILLEQVVAESKERTFSYEIEEAKNNYNNDDIVGILEIPNTTYKTFVTQTDNNSYYLSRGLNKKKDGNGTPFLDYRVDIDSSKKLLIYGHNSRYKEMPFEILEEYYDESYLKTHQNIVLKTETKTNIYEIFSVFIETNDWTYTNIKFDSDDDWLEHLQKLKEKSIHDVGVELTKEDEVLILQTCSTKKEYLKYKKKFLLVIARKVG